MPVTVVELSGGAARAQAATLAGLLIDCVEGGAAVGFVGPPSPAEAERFWLGIAEAIEEGATTLFAAFRDETLVGTTMLVYPKAQNQPHRADVAKVLVHRGARRLGIASALMEEAEVHARRLGRTSLLLDTTTGSEAELFYRRLGWTEVGVVPEYFIRADGTPWATTLFWKRL